MILTLSWRNVTFVSPTKKGSHRKKRSFSSCTYSMDELPIGKTQKLTNITQPRISGKTMTHSLKNLKTLGEKWTNPEWHYTDCFIIRNLKEQHSTNSSQGSIKILFNQELQTIKRRRIYSFWVYQPK